MADISESKARGNVPFDRPDRIAGAMVDYMHEHPEHHCSDDRVIVAVFDDEAHKVGICFGNFPDDTVERLEYLIAALEGVCQSAGLTATVGISNAN